MQRIARHGDGAPIAATQPCRLASGRHGLSTMSASNVRCLWVLAIVALFSSSGCMSNTKLRGLAVQLLDVKATPAADGGAELALTFRYVNENNVALAISTVRHRVSLGSISLPRFETPEPIGLPRLASDTQAAKVRVDAATVSRLRELQSAGAVSYRVESTIIVEAATDKLESRTSDSGTLNLSRLGL
jgi:LEA14-like dessication related protein